MKKIVKGVLLLMVVCIATFGLVGCGKDKNTNNEPVADETETTGEIDIKSLSDEEKIEHLIHGLLKTSYRDQLDSAKIYVDKMYTPEEVQQDETIKSLNIGEKDIPFEVSMYLLPVEGADINLFTVADGEYNEETGWVSDVHRLGVLRYNEVDDIYYIDNYGTGW